MSMKCILHQYPIDPNVIQLCCYLVEFLVSENPTEHFVQIIEAMPSVKLLSTQAIDPCRFTRFKFRHSVDNSGKGAHN